MKSYTILIVEEKTPIREKICVLLKSEGYNVIETSSGEESLLKMNDAIDLLILSIELSGISGIKVCEIVRRNSNVPILCLSSYAEESDKTLGLTIGADDYMAKPFSYGELIARVKALLRRYCVYKGKKNSMTLDEDQILECDRLMIALDRNEVWKDGMFVDLTEIEYKILGLLVQHPQRVFSKQMIYERVWNEPYTYGANSTIMVHIQKLRSKIEDDPKNPIYIKNIWGKGYRYERGLSH